MIQIHFILFFQSPYMSGTERMILFIYCICFACDIPNKSQKPPQFLTGCSGRGLWEATPNTPSLRAGGRSSWETPTLMRCLLTHLVKVFFCTRSRSSAETHRDTELVQSQS